MKRSKKSQKTNETEVKITKEAIYSLLSDVMNYSKQLDKQDKKTSKSKRYVKVEKLLSKNKNNK